MIALTDSAVEAIRRVISNAEDAVAGLRIMVQSGGCSGLTYQMGLESAPQDGDAVIECGGITVFVDSESQALIEGIEVDFVEQLEGSGFVFNNPNATAKCGCGKSFSC
ncbi:iron-sulfur cluster assembly accessory protein [Telmatospirillum sp. J64-1]|uniref:HesB/IscA family protein n=1 Tax=Telmatospirillum sp. J64-1 TaxID=2502183 RepID=UPI00115E2C4C|nr:iron-sulfur cluster assembly accessory protein [Telmatospirillum sp. J64-1]